MGIKIKRFLVFLVKIVTPLLTVVIVGIQSIIMFKQAEISEKQLELDRFSSAPIFKVSRTPHVTSTPVKAEYFKLENTAGSIRIQKNQIEDNHLMDVYLYERCSSTEELDSESLPPPKYAKVMLAEVEPNIAIESYGGVNLLRFEMKDFPSLIDDLERKINETLNPSGRCIEIKPRYIYRIQYSYLQGNRKPETIFVEFHPLYDGRIVSKDQYDSILSSYNIDEECMLIQLENHPELIKQVTGANFEKCFLF